MTVVVGVDGSPRSQSAVQAAAQEARYRDVPVMGAVGWKIGPAGRYLLRNSPCPVMVVPGSSEGQT